MKPILVTGIGTDVGKTIVSAILVEYFKGAYWKPVQTGEIKDRETVAGLVSSEEIIFFDEIFHLKLPASPHIAAKKENITITKNDFYLPQTNKKLIIETAGGIKVPLNYEGLTYLDLFKDWDIEIIVVSKFYLGSINHTLLTIEAINKYAIPIKGIIYNGNEMEGTVEVIENITRIPTLLKIKQETTINKEVIKKYSQMLNLI